MDLSGSDTPAPVPPLRILHVGLGPLGLRIVRDLHASGRGVVVAAVDPAPQLHGRPLAALVPGSDPAVVIAPDLESIDPRLRLDAAIVTTVSDLTAAAPTFRAILARGLAVVSTCETLVHPWTAHSALAGELHDLAVTHGARLLGTGVNPGFVMDALPLFVTAACLTVRRLEVHRVQDAAIRRLPFQRKIGVGLSEAEVRSGLVAGRLGHVGLGESLHALAAGLGFRIDRLEQDGVPVLATAGISSALGPVAQGRVAGVRQTARGYEGTTCVLELRFQAVLGEPDPHDRVIIDGEPPVDLRIASGIHGDVATSALVLNALPRLLAAPPGLATMATLPLVHAVRAQR